jgi:choline dehydrogenase-like flavoprotein
MHTTDMNPDTASIGVSAPKRILQSVLTALNEGRIAEAAAQFDDHFTFTDYALDIEFTDRGRLVEFFQKTRELFPDTVVEVDSTFQCGDYVNGPLEIQPNFLEEPADVDALAAGVELGLDIASQPAYRDLIKRWIVPPRRMSREDRVTFIRRFCLSYLHPVGTCAMGLGEEAVVDAELHVRGVEGLRIADASVMPTTPSANTNAPSIMIGEFVSRLLTGVRINRAVTRSSPARGHDASDPRGRPS